MKISKTEHVVFVFYKLKSNYKNLANLKRSWFKIKKKMSDLKWNASLALQLFFQFFKVQPFLQNFSSFLLIIKKFCRFCWIKPLIYSFLQNFSCLWWTFNLFEWPFNANNILFFCQYFLGKLRFVSLLISVRALVLTELQILFFFFGLKRFFQKWKSNFNWF
jgi:hypothetical protein